jgi:maltose O-acetyltransferase
VGKVIVQPTPVATPWFPLPVRLVLKVLRRLAFWLRMVSLYCHSPAHLARIAREHHLSAVRIKAWQLSGTFEMGEAPWFNAGVSVIVGRWGNVAAKLGDRVGIADGTIFIAASEPAYCRLSDIEGFSERHTKYEPIIVGNDSWIGANVTIMPGVKIGQFCVIGAGAVVTKDVPDYSIAAGVPARVIGDVREAATAR